MNIIGWFSKTFGNTALALPELSQESALSLNQKDLCLAELQSLSDKRTAIIYPLSKVMTEGLPLGSTIKEHQEQIAIGLERAEELRRQSIFCLNQYIYANPGSKNTKYEHEVLWEQLQILDADEASILSFAVTNDWIPIPPIRIPSPTQQLSFFPKEITAQKIVHFATNHWKSISITAVSLGFYALENAYAPEISAYWHPMLLAGGGFVYSPKLVGKELWSLSKAALKTVVENALPIGIGATTISYYYEPNINGPLSLLALTTIGYLASIYLNPPSTQSLCNRALGLTKTWLEYGNLTGIPAALLCGAVSRYFEQSLLTNLSWTAFGYASHAIPSMVIAASRTK